MMLLLLLPLCQFTRQVDIYIPLFQGNVAVSEAGSVFLLDQREGKVHVFDRDQWVLTFGRKGDGPGEFHRPARLSTEGGFLYVHDMDRIHQFGLEGGFVKTIRLPEPFLLLERVIGGWAGHTSPILSDGEIEFKGFGERIRNGETFFIAPDGTREKGKHRLFQTSPRLMVDRMQQVIIVVEFESFKIHIFDGKTKSHLRTIEKRFEPLAIDRKWAAKRIAGYEKGDPFPGRIQTLVPDHFPQIRKVTVSPENHLLVFRWAPGPDRPDRLVFSLEGKNAASAIKTMEGAARVLGVVNGKAIVSTFNDEIGRLHLVPFAEVDAFVAHNPLVFDMDVLFPRLPPKPP